MTSSESVNSGVVMCGLDPPSTTAWTTPPSPPTTAPTTTARSLVRYVSMPSTAARASFSRTAAMAWPARERISQVTAHHARTRKARASQYRYGAFATPTRRSGTPERVSALPSSPPVRSPGLRSTMMDAACAKARVTMAKAIPPTRKEIAPTTRASTVVPANASSAASHSGNDHDAIDMVRR